MVDAAQQKQAQEHEVVVGFIDTHDHPEFSSLLSGLEVIPPQEIEYGGVHFQELNVDAIIERHPEIVLIDELAHSNITGARHPKRYQDVIDVLQAGISVYTTMNVQHVSSVAAAVTELTGIEVREQVPDFVLEMASSIRLIDLAPEELVNRLVKRLKQPGDDDLFKPANLVTLRELALRIAAARVDEDVRKIAGQPLEPWAGSSKLLVGVSASPSNERLIRATYQLATELRTTWLAVHVQTSADNRLGDAARARIEDHLQLAKELGAEALTVAGQNLARQLIEVAEQYNAARIVVGRSKRRGAFGRAHSLADEIMDASETLDILILRG